MTVFSTGLRELKNSTYNRTLTGIFSANLDADALDALRADPSVASIEEDGVSRTLSIVTQTNAVQFISLLSCLQLMPISTLALGHQPCRSR
jgi:hypothetical protein